MKKVLFILILVPFLVSCKHNRVLFTTHTSIGLDVSGTAQYPNKVSFSHNRYEAAIIPRKTNGEAHSVYGGMDADMHWWKGSIIKQTFATGQAAKYATGTEPTPEGSSKLKAETPLVFFTGTTFGLHLSAGESQMAPNLLMGYRRTEATVIPIPDPSQEVRSVYADILINSTDPNPKGSLITTNFSQVNGVRIKQAFATGVAADALAANSEEVRDKLNNAAGVQATARNLQKLKEKARVLSDDISEELDKLDNNHLDAAVEAVKAAEFDISDAERASLKALEPRTKALKLKKVMQRDYSSKDDVQRLTNYLGLLKKLNQKPSNPTNPI